MPIIDRQLDAHAHLVAIFRDQEPVTITRGELEQYRCLRRELYALKAAISLHDPKTVLITGEVLKTLLDLV